MAKMKEERKWRWWKMKGINKWGKFTDILRIGLVFNLNKLIQKHTWHIITLNHCKLSIIFKTLLFHLWTELIPTIITIVYLNVWYALNNLHKCYGFPVGIFHSVQLVPKICLVLKWQAVYCASRSPNEYVNWKWWKHQWKNNKRKKVRFIDTLH